MTSATGRWPSIAGLALSLFLFTSGAGLAAEFIEFYKLGLARRRRGRLDPRWRDDGEGDRGAAQGQGSGDQVLLLQALPAALLPGQGSLREGRLSWCPGGLGGVGAARRGDALSRVRGPTERSSRLSTGFRLEPLAGPGRGDHRAGGSGGCGLSPRAGGAERLGSGLTITSRSTGRSRGRFGPGPGSDLRIGHHRQRGQAAPGGCRPFHVRVRGHPDRRGGATNAARGAPTAGRPRASWTR